MKILYIYKRKNECELISSELGEGNDLTFAKSLDELSPEIKKDQEVLSFFFKGVVGKEELDQLPSLKMLSIRATGFDNIDLDLCRERGIIVSNVPRYGEHTIAEHTFGLILALSKKICTSYEKMKESPSFQQKDIRGFDLHGKNLGVVGTGSIGLNVIRLAKAFGMKVSAFDPFPKYDESERIGFEYKDFDSIMRECDILTFHAPQNKHTHHMINTKNIEKIKKGAYVINTSRGGLIESRALVKALKDGHIAGAGLDVLEEEYLLEDEDKILNEDNPNQKKLQTLILNQYLIRHPKVLVTPHNAYNTKEAFGRIIKTTIENIKAFIENEPINKIDI